MKFSTLFLVATLFTAQQAFAECKTVMGGCTTEEVVNVAPHMRSENNKPVVNNAKPAPVASNKNIKNTNASASQASTTTATRKL